MSRKSGMGKGEEPFKTLNDSFTIVEDRKSNRKSKVNPNYPLASHRFRNLLATLEGKIFNPKIPSRDLLKYI